MIAVQSLYQECQDYLKTYRGGYLNNDEFNRAVNQAQNYLFNLLIESTSVDRYNNESLAPFRKESLITKSSGAYTTPADFAAIREVAVEWVKSDGETIYKPCYIIMDQGLVFTSPIRKPTTTTFGYTKEANFKLYPTTNAKLFLKYFRNPDEAERKVTYSGDDEVYNPTGTIDLEWNETDKHMILDLTLYYAGIITSMPDVVNWVQSRNSFIPMNAKDYQR